MHSRCSNGIWATLTPSISCEGSAGPMDMMWRVGPLQNTLLRSHAWNGDSFLHHPLSWPLPPSGLHALFSIMRTGYVFLYMFSQLLIILTIYPDRHLSWHIPHCTLRVNWSLPQILLNYVLKPTEHELFYKKYASKEYLKVHQQTTTAWLVTHDPVVVCMGSQMGSWVVDWGYSSHTCWGASNVTDPD